MIGLPSSTKIYLATDATDLRKGVDGLTAEVRAQFGEDAVFSGHLFVFLAARGTRAKILFWDRGGFVLYYKRLEQGRFHRPAVRDGVVTMTPAELSSLLEGIDLAKARRAQLWEPKRTK